jgi:hypothetical protein
MIMTLQNSSRLLSFDVASTVAPQIFRLAIRLNYVVKVKSAGWYQQCII